MRCHFECPFYCLYTTYLLSFHFLYNWSIKLTCAGITEAEELFFDCGYDEANETTALVTLVKDSLSSHTFATVERIRWRADGPRLGVRKNAPLLAKYHGTQSRRRRQKRSSLRRSTLRRQAGIHKCIEMHSIWNSLSTSGVYVDFNKLYYRTSPQIS